MRQYTRFLMRHYRLRQVCCAASEDARARFIRTGTRLGRSYPAALLKQGRKHRPGSERAGTHHNDRKEVGWLAFA